jgi:hypothetical protein
MAKAKALLVLLALGSAAGCFYYRPSAPPPPPPESYVQDAVRNMTLWTEISWTFDYQPADPNAAQVWSTETAPNKMREDLNELGREDGNSFVVPDSSKKPNLIIRVHQYCNGQQGENYAASLMAELWALGHRDLVCRVRTDSFRYESDAVYDLSKRLYAWLHTGWHTNDRN